MAIPTTNVSLGGIQTEFGGSNPISLSEYYEGGSIIGNVVYAPNNIPASGLISLDNFRSSEATHSYRAAKSANYTYAAQIGYSVDYFNGKLRINCGYYQLANATLSQLVFATSSSDMSTWGNVVQLELTTQGYIEYGYESKLIKNDPAIYSNQPTDYMNIVTPTGETQAPTDRWLIAARWNGGSSITMWRNTSWNGTGDTGSNISMSNLASAFNELSGNTSDSTFTFTI
jgi:hypothetical protein